MKRGTIDVFLAEVDSKGGVERSLYSPKSSTEFKGAPCWIRNATISNRFCEAAN